VSLSAAQIAWKMAFTLSPIVLTGGIAAQQGNALPIIALTEGPYFSGEDIIGIAEGSSSVAATQGAADPYLDNFFASYYPLPGGTLIANEISHYPFANQAIAANATIAQPLLISLMMVCPAKKYSEKFHTMLSLQSSLKQHSSLGGTYSVVTPSGIYTDCILKTIRDVSGGEVKQAQYLYQWDFEQPLVSLEAAAGAQQALNNQLQAINNQTPPATASANASGLPVTNPTSVLNSAVPQ
jgi:hypothetical protein